MCEHLWILDPENPTTPPDAGGRRVVNLACSRCDERLSKLTNKSDRQLAAELALQTPALEAQ